MKKDSGVNTIKRSADLKKSAGTAAPLVNEYYLNIERKIKAVRWILAVFTLVLALAGLVMFREDITVDNINYLLRFIDLHRAGSTEAGSSFDIDGSEGVRMGYYKNNLVVLDKEKIEMYDLSGEKLFSFKQAYSNPVLVTGDKYLLTYDLGAGKYALYNGFSGVHSYEGDQPVYGANINDRGMFAVISSASGYRSVVTAYNNTMKEYFRWSSRDKYTTACALDSNGGRMAVASFTAKDGDYLCELALFDTSSEEQLAGISLPAQLPLAMDYVGGSLVLVTDAGAYIYSEDLQQIGGMSFYGRQLGRYKIGEDGLIFNLTQNNSDHRSDIYVFDKNGSQVYYTNIQADILDISLGEGKGWALARQGLYSFGLSDASANTQSSPPMLDESVQGSGLKYIAYSDSNSVLLCADTSARLVREHTSGGDIAETSEAAAGTEAATEGDAKAVTVESTN